MCDIIQSWHPLSALRVSHGVDWRCLQWDLQVFHDNRSALVPLPMWFHSCFSAILWHNQSHSPRWWHQSAWALQLPEPQAESSSWLYHPPGSWCFITATQTRWTQGGTVIVPLKKRYRQRTRPSQDTQWGRTEPCIWCHCMSALMGSPQSQSRVFFSFCMTPLLLYWIKKITKLTQHSTHRCQRGTGQLCRQAGLT